MTDHPYDHLIRELRAACKSVYVVNEKVTYERKWRIHVMFNDGATTTQWTDDDAAARDQRLHLILKEAKRRGKQ